MTLAAGSVTVASDATYTGSGAALLLFEALDAEQTYPDPASPPAGYDPTAWASLAVSLKRAAREQLAATATGLAAPTFMRDDGSGGGGGGGWSTILDLDFTSQASQALSADGTYTIGGLSWTKANSANDSVAMALTSGTGLVIQPASSTDVSGATRSSPSIRVPLSQLAIPNLGWSTRLRIWLYVSASNEAGNYDNVGVALDTGDTSREYATLRYYDTGSIVILARKIIAASNTDVRTIGIGTTAANNVIVSELEGLIPTAWRMYTGAYSAGFPAEKALVPYVGHVGMASVDRGTATTADTMGITIFAGRAGSGSSYSATIARLRVDYAP